MLCSSDRPKVQIRPMEWHRNPPFPIRHTQTAYITPQANRPSRRKEVVDLRNECTTEAEARQQLSSYVVIRLEKSRNPHELDEEGYPIRPTWERASHVRQTDISQQEATRKVYHLQITSDHVTDKKNALPSVIQRQLRIAQDRLRATESDPRYQYTLAQLDQKLRPVKLPTDQGASPEKSRKDKDQMRKKSKKKYERASVTAYFKRAPGPHENCMRMLEDEEMQREQSSRVSPRPVNTEFPPAPRSRRELQPAVPRLYIPPHTHRHPYQQSPSSIRSPRLPRMSPRDFSQIPSSQGQFNGAHVTCPPSAVSQRSSQTSFAFSSPFESDASEPLTPVSSNGSHTYHATHARTGDPTHGSIADTTGPKASRRHSKLDQRYEVAGPTYPRYNGRLETSVDPTVPVSIEVAQRRRREQRIGQGNGKSIETQRRQQQQQHGTLPPQVVRGPAIIRQHVYNEDLDELEDRFERMEMQEKNHRAHERDVGQEQHIPWPDKNYNEERTIRPWDQDSRVEKSVAESERAWSPLKAQEYMRSRAFARNFDWGDELSSLGERQSVSIKSYSRRSRG